MLQSIIYKINIRAALSCTILCFYITLHGQQFTATTLNGEIINNENISELTSKQIKVYERLKSTSESDSLIQTLINLSQLSRINLKYDMAYNYAGEALFLSDEINDSKLLMLSHQEYGYLNYLLKQDNAAGNNFRQSLCFAKKAYEQGKISHKDLYPSYYGNLLFLQRSDDAINMNNYIDTCQQFIDQYNWGIEKEIYIKEKTAYILHLQNRKEEAVNLLKEVEKIILNDETLHTHKSFLIVIQGVIANKLQTLDRYDEAERYFRKALTQEDRYGEHTFYIEYLHTSFARVLFKNGDSKNAYYNMQKAKAINDKFLNPRKDATQGFLSVKDRYREEINRKNESLQLQAVELAEERAKSWKFRVIFFVIIFILVITIVLIKRKQEQLNHKIENEAFLERRRYNEALIAKNNKELTSNTLQLIEKDEIIKTLSDLIKSEIPKDKATPILKSIEQQSNNLWDDFNNRFMAQNSDFYERLQKTCPNLSSSDLKICALIKLNFSGKEMAYLLGISESSVHVARHRLRKKFNIERDTNLTQYINSI